MFCIKTINEINFVFEQEHYKIIIPDLVEVVNHEQNHPIKRKKEKKL